MVHFIGSITLLFDQQEPVSLTLTPSGLQY